MELNENYTIKDYLIKLRTKNVYIILNSGKEYLGIIKDVGQFCLILEQKGQRSYFDSIIRIDDISSVEFQVRGS
ncbi:MAG: hypothetical protein ACFFC3_05450 [Candidatus Odinarchaeota archaeon]